MQAMKSLLPWLGYVGPGIAFSTARLGRGYA